MILNLNEMRENIKVLFKNKKGINRSVDKDTIIEYALKNQKQKITDKYSSLIVWKSIKYCFKQLRNDKDPLFIICDFDNTNNKYVWFVLNSEKEAEKFEQKLKSISKGINKTVKKAYNFLDNN